MQKWPRVHLARCNSDTLIQTDERRLSSYDDQRPNPYAISIAIDARIDYLVIAQANRNVTLVINDVAALN